MADMIRFTGVRSSQSGVRCFLGGKPVACISCDFKSLLGCFDVAWIVFDVAWKLFSDFASSFHTACMLFGSVWMFFDVAWTFFGIALMFFDVG